LMFTPEISIAALRAIQNQFKERIYGRYGFIDAYNPTLQWFDSDVVGIDLGISLLSAENLLTGNVWRWFMANEPATRAMVLIGFSAPPTPAPAPAKPQRSVPRYRTNPPPKRASALAAGTRSPARKARDGTAPAFAH
jgi:hypothetical protein